MNYEAEFAVQWQRQFAEASRLSVPCSPCFDPETGWIADLEGYDCEVIDWPDWCWFR